MSNTDGVRAQFVDSVIALIPEGREQECAEALFGIGLGMFEQLDISLDEILAAVRRNHKPLRAVGRLK